MAEKEGNKTTFRSKLDGLKIGEQRFFRFDNPRQVFSSSVNAYNYAQQNGITIRTRLDYETNTLYVTRMA